jgi:TonB-dependent siderophore receptor
LSIRFFAVRPFYKCIPIDCLNTKINDGETIVKILLTISTLFIAFTIFVDVLAAQETKTYTVKGDSLVVEALRERPIPKFSTVATKLDIELQKIPFGVGVINNSFINNQNNFYLSDALKNISGVNAQTGFGVHDYFIIRGLNSLENSLILTDGTPEPEVTYYNLYNVERIELLKGPGAFLYGSNSLSGTVNIVRKQPLFRNFFKFRTTAGQFTTHRSSIDAGLGNLENGLASRINILYEKANNYRDDKKNNVIAINPSVTWLLKNKTTLNLNLEFIASNYNPDSGLPLLYNPFSQQLDKIPDVQETTSYQAPFDFSDQKILRVKLNVDRKINQSFRIHNKLYYTRLDWQSKGTLLNGAFPTATGSTSVYRSLSELDDLRNFIGNQSEFILSFQTGKFAHTFLTGLELTAMQENYTYDIAPEIPEIDIKHPVETAIESEIFMYPYLRGNVSNVVIAPYIMDRIILSEQLQATAGLRYDIIKFENTAENYLTDRNYSNLSPTLGVTYSPVSTITFYANSSRAYGPPSSQVIGEQDAQRSGQIEVGLKQRYFNGLVNLDLAYYNLQKDNIPIIGIDGISKQLGDQQSRGIEIDLSVEPMHKWFTFMSYSYSDAKLTTLYEKVTIGRDDFGRPIEMVFDRSGNIPAFTPKHMLNIWSTKGFENGFGVGAGLIYLGKQFIGNDNVFQMNESLVLNAKIYFKARHWQLGMHIKNITNEQYYYRGFGASSLIPANPQAVYVVLDLSM